MNRHLSPLATVTLMVVALLSAAATASAAYPGDEGRIAFVRDGAIWTAETDGSDELRLTGTGTAYTPVWSPDGQRIAFTWYRRSPDTRADIWTMAADGSDKRQVTAERAWEASPSWSPNGRWIAFMSDREEIGFGAAAIYKIRSSADARARQLTDGGVSWGGLESINETNPAWSPLGNVIVFQRNFSDGGCAGCGFAEFWTITPDGETETRLLAPGDAREPAWSPYGKRIAYSFATLSGDMVDDSANVSHVAADGTDVRAVTRFEPGSGLFAQQPAWSPDHGERIVFTHWRAGGGDPGIWMVGSRGLEEPVPIIENGYDPDWQPLPTGQQ